ncbi:unnamed protein product [Gongylonema pulchrum]|uniref:SAM_MT_RSMB_NOP domain-containing protein n=1 Tax=Gongylonema pulchrum TaxID=637853 RepID=A0A183CX43_9BILA|nr:unnamed protein product [Gongylonema pulchrum]
MQDLLKKPNFDYSLLCVLLYEYVFGHGLRSVNKLYSAPILQRAAYIDQQLETVKAVDRVEESDAQQCSAAALYPRYARINTLRWSVDDALKALQDEGWIVSNMKSQEDTNWYRNAVASMTECQVYIDNHIRTLLLFPPNTDLHDHWMVVDGYLMLQDKASCLPGQILKPKSGSQIFDVCAAPGMKSTHLAAVLRNEGKIWAIDRDSDRVKTMRKIVNRAGATCISILHGDFLRIDVTDRKFSEVHYALVDPPCSGSGIVKRMDELTDDNEAKNFKRLQSLSNLQAMLLKHTMKLPNLKKVVYSTCSIYEEENEKVVEEILSDELLSEQFELACAMPKWPHRGKPEYPFGDKCLRASSDLDLSNGFFVALFKRRKK